MIILDVMFWSAYLVSFYITVFLLITFFEQRPERRKVRFAKFPKVSVIIPAHNEEDSICGTIDSVLALDYPKDALEIIVVNDGSKDRTKDMVEKYAKKGVILINQKQSGKGSALNAGIKKSTGEFVACLDADSFVEKDTLKRMIGYFESENVAAVTPIMKVRMPETLIQKAQWLEYVLYAFMKMVLASIDCVHVTPGPFSIYRKSSINEIEGFSETSIVEDQEIAYRLQKNNYRIAQSLEGNVYTIAPRTLTELYMQRSRWYKGSISTLYEYRAMLFNRKYGDFGMYHLPSILAGMMILFVVVALFANYFVAPGYELAHHLALVDFDVTPYMSLENKDVGQIMISKMIGQNYSKIFITLLLFIISIAIMVKAHETTGERIGVRSAVPLVFFFLIYYLILSFVWLCSMIELALGLRKKW